MKQCYAALERHKTLPPAEFVDEGMFRLLVTDLLNTKQFAKEKLRLWLHDDNQLVVFWSSYTLRDAHRLWLGLVRRRIKAAQSSRLDDAASAALLLLQVKGRVRSCVTDCNLDGEPLFVEAGGDGWDEEDVTLFSSSILHLRADLPPQVLALAQAGCDLRAVNCMGHSGLSQAAAYGNTATLCAMLQVGADVAQYSPGKGMGALFRASYNGHVACVRALVQHKADMDAALADGTTCCYVAAEKGHSELLRFLIQSGAAVDKPDNNSVTPLWRAAERGVAECVEILINARANAEALDKDAKSALRAAACNGHDRIVDLLQAAGAIIGLDDEVGHSA
jgi:ankyrin repeat protein